MSQYLGTTQKYWKICLSIEITRYTAQSQYFLQPCPTGRDFPQIDHTSTKGTPLIELSAVNFTYYPCRSRPPPRRDQAKLNFLIYRLFLTLCATVFGRITFHQLVWLWQNVCSFCNALALFSRRPVVRCAFFFHSFHVPASVFLHFSSNLQLCSMMISKKE